MNIFLLTWYDDRHNWIPYVDDSLNINAILTIIQGHARDDKIARISVNLLQNLWRNPDKTWFGVEKCFSMKCIVFFVLFDH